MKDYHLFLDDVRDPAQCLWYTFKPVYTKESWVVVRNYDQFVDTVIEHGLPKLVSFDHDLADEHYELDKMKKGEEMSYSSYKEKTGLSCAKFMIDYCRDNNLPFPEYLVHSMNPVGKQNIINTIEDYDKECKAVNDLLGEV